MWGLKPYFPPTSDSHTHIDSQSIAFANLCHSNPDPFPYLYTHPSTDRNARPYSHFSPNIDTRTGLGHAWAR